MNEAPDPSDLIGINGTHVVREVRDPVANTVRITCKCSRTELVDDTHPNFAHFKALPEPRRAVCSKCAIAAFSF